MAGLRRTPLGCNVGRGRYDLWVAGDNATCFADVGCARLPNQTERRAISPLAKQQWSERIAR
jgi:hypothetical protein